MLTLTVLDKAADQSCSIEELARHCPPTWEEVFESAKPELRDVSMILEEQEKNFGIYYPLKKDIFNAFHYTPLNKVKVVIIGQDPYHQSIVVGNESVPRATGMSFSIRREDSVPSSLQNIYKEL